MPARIALAHYASGLGLVRASTITLTPSSLYLSLSLSSPTAAHSVLHPLHCPHPPHCSLTPCSEAGWRLACSSASARCSCRCQGTSAYTSLNMSDSAGLASLLAALSASTTCGLHAHIHTLLTRAVCHFCIAITSTEWGNHGQNSPDALGLPKAALCITAWTAYLHRMRAIQRNGQHTRASTTL